MSSSLDSEVSRPTIESVRAVQAFTGRGMMEVASALRLCGGDLLHACGYLHYAGCAVNLKGKDPVLWALSCGKGYAQGLCITDSGEIAVAVAPVEFSPNP